MPRRTSSKAVAGIYHITHRYHNKEFLFKFSKHLSENNGTQASLREYST